MKIDDKEKFYVGHGTLRYKGDWIIVEVPFSIVNYYKWWVEKFIWKKTSTSFHKPHITVLAGKHEKGLNKHPMWGKYEGAVVPFKYYSTVKTDEKGEYYWLLVECDFLKKVRMELGLNPELKFPLHATICYCGY